MRDRYEVPAGFAGPATIDAATRDALYARSLADPDGFWLEQAARLDWIVAPTRAGDWSFNEADFHVRWFADGVLNVTANCLDRHVAAGNGERTAILWEPDEPSEQPRAFSYAEALAETCRFANVLAGMGVAKGDRVTIYMPMIPEAAFAMLACARLGAIHSVVFGGFSAEALASRIADCGSRLVVTADEGRRGGRRIALKATVDQALAKADGVSVLVVRATGADVSMTAGRDAWYHDRAADAAMTRPPEPMAAEDPLFILYTSGSTGRPKGVMHTQGGYLLWAAMTHAITFDYRAPEVFWCAADVGWVTGHSYILYGPLANGATTLMYEGVPNWPDASRIWQVVDRHQVTTLYTAPTALRALMREGDAPVKAADRGSLRLLGTVGEPINPEAWRWYHEVVGEGRCPIVDTWWQTETGGHMITPLPGATPLKPGSATLPFFGIEPKLLAASGEELAGEAEGALVIARSWPGQMRGVWGDDARFFETYFRSFPGRYDTGDGARRDADGYWWITGRTDDVINVSGHRMGTAEVESALVLDEAVAEAAVVGFPHEVKGQGIYAFVTPVAGIEADEALAGRLRDRVRSEIGAIASPDAIQFAPALPKTRSGKIMRRILRKIAAGETGDLGDVSTLAEPAVVDDLVANRIGGGRAGR